MKPRNAIARMSAKKLQALGGVAYSTITPKPAKKKIGTRKAMMIRKTKPKARNAKRRASEFARCYGSKERVRWVKSLPCLYCIAVHPLLVLAYVGAGTSGRSENAHTVTGGTGRKADAKTIVPLCAHHHTQYDRHVGPLGERSIRDDLKAKAADIDALWERECVRRGVSSLASDGE